MGWASPRVQLHTPRGGKGLTASGVTAKGGDLWPEQPILSTICSGRGASFGDMRGKGETQTAGTGVHSKVLALARGSESCQYTRCCYDDILKRYHEKNVWLAGSAVTAKRGLKVGPSNAF